MRGVLVYMVTLATALVVSEQASAQPPPQNLWTKFETLTPHTTVAGLACAMEVKVVIDGRTVGVTIDASEDIRQICVGTPSPNALHARVKMTLDPARRPNEIIFEVDLPPNASPRTTEDLRAVLLNVSAELERRAKGSMPPPPTPVVVVQQPPPQPQVPMHAVTVTNTGLIAAGGAIFGGGYLVTLLIGSAIVGAAGDPGTGRFWPFVPFVGAVVFAGSYREAANCDCDAGRAISIAGAILIDAVQIAGVVISIVGLASPKTKMVPDTASLRVRFGPSGAMLEGRF